MKSVELLFLGTGTSAGVPMIGCDCEVCRSTDPHDSRTRPSVVISYGDTRVLVDTTPELRVQCLANDVKKIDAVVFTHAHADHIMGLDDVRRFNALKEGPIDVWADKPSFDAIRTCFGYAFRPPQTEEKTFRPMLVERMIEGPFQIDGVTWTPIDLLHGDESVLGFRIGNLAYCTDVNLIPQRSYEKLKDLDVLVLDALAPVPHSKHFSLPEALEAARRIGAKRTLFTHIAHRLPHEATNRELPANVQLAYDGQRVTASL
ncbi:MAG TPA: MBL fold metallo-hydrolase [Tepidisphaeraceae bacterium]|jgi:phosphoribosyl 1,2-cyclic phosphate phosphodiesterase|nr:MBL fold metallo-hydrolase [Tepidisphaeraceae bacterium]